jgi:hypothetical protein
MHLWVYFRDKGESLGEDTETMLQLTSTKLLPRPRARRSKNMIGSLVDYLDIPVCDEYVEDLLHLGVKLRHRSRWLNAVSVATMPEMVWEIKNLPCVLRVAPVKKLGRPDSDWPRRSDIIESSRSDLIAVLHRILADTSFYGASFPYLDEIGVIAVQDSGYTGDGVLVGMLDTGYYKEHEAFDSLTVLAEWDFVFGDGETQNESEDDPSQHDHGTAIWSILGGYVPGTLIGPAYGASFILAKTEDITSETPVEEDNFVAALEWGDSLGVDVMSASLIYRYFDDPQNDYPWEDLDGNTATTTVAVDIAASRGILVVGAIGNSGPDPGSLGTPADADSIISVGGFDEENDLLGFSGRGPTFDGRIKPEVLARGVDVYHAFPSTPSSYTYSAGTSVATPLVGGAAALVMEAHPDWSAMQVRSALMWTAEGASHPDNDRGWGKINVHSAIYGPAVPHHILPFNLLNPIDGAGATGNHVQFSWMPARDIHASEPVCYSFRLDRDGGFKEPVFETTLPDTALVVDCSRLQEGQYYWTVYAVDSEGRERMAGEVRKVIIH